MEAAEHKSMGLTALAWNKPTGDDFESSLVRFVEDRYVAGKQARLNWESRAAQQLAWVGGRQLLRALSNESGSIALTPFDFQEEQQIPLEHRQPIMVNHLKGVVLQKISMLLNTPITWWVQAMSGDDDDVDAARVQQKLAQYLWFSGRKSMRAKLPKALWVMFASGIVFPKVVWDPWMNPEGFRPKKATKPRSHEATKEEEASEPGSDDQSEIDNRQSAIPNGWPEITFVPGFEITEPEACDSIEEAAYVLHSYPMSLETLRARYGNAAMAIEPDTEPTLEEWRRVYTGVWDPDNTRSILESESAMVHELWRPRCLEVERGFFGVVAGGVVLRTGTHPYDHGLMPFTELRELPEPRFRPESTVGNCMTLQDARNRVRSQEAAHIHMTVGGKILHEKTAGLPENAFERGPKLIPVNDDGLNRIRAWIPPPMPPGMREFDESLRVDLQNVSGIHDSSQGRRESNVTSGRHAAVLQQADMRETAATRLLIEEGLSRTCVLALHLLYQYASAKTMVIITGEGMTAEVLKFKGSDLYPAKKTRPQGPATFNVRAIIGSEPNMAATLDKVETLTKLGYRRPDRETDRIAVNKWLGDQAPGEMDETATQRSAAAWENQRLLDGDDKVFAVVGDDDELHLWEHLRATTGHTYRKAVAKQPEVKDIFLVHIREHEIQLAEKQLRPLVTAAMTKERLRLEWLASPFKDFPFPLDGPAAGPAQPGGGLFGRGAVPMGGGLPGPGSTPPIGGPGGMNGSGRPTMPAVPAMPAAGPR